MVTIHIPDALASQLKARAQQENRSIDDVAAEILEQHLLTDDPPPGTLAALIAAAKKTNIASGYTDTS
jgi:plasmid stability protein